MASELKPCPFCGGEASKRMFYGARYGIYCDSCDARVGGLFSTEAEAVKAWNTRAERTCKAEQPMHDGFPIVNASPHCSECGMEWGVLPMKPNYCQNCGAKVVKE